MQTRKMNSGFDSYTLNSETEAEFRDVLANLLEKLIRFKLEANPVGVPGPTVTSRLVNFEVPENGLELREIARIFSDEILPYCSNFSNSRFLGFPDSGDGTAALLGAIAADFVNANLINQTFCAPVASMVEIGMLRWLREQIGYDSLPTSHALDACGCFTNGGTASNSIAMLAARDRWRKLQNQSGVATNEPVVIVPDAIGHYSIRASNHWIGSNAAVVKSPIQDFRYDLPALRSTLQKHNSNVMAIVAYAGDSRTCTVDRIDSLVRLRDETAPNAWLHVDACHGFPLVFEDEGRLQLRGVESVDSITLDPHKVLLVPYTLSAILFKNREDFAMLRTQSDLIMSEQFSLGQTTPLIGSKQWASLKLWFQLKSLGRKGLSELVRERRRKAMQFAEIVRSRPDFRLLAVPDYNAVLFQFQPQGDYSDEQLNEINRTLHKKCLADGRFHVHIFPLSWKGDDLPPIYPLRVMIGSPKISEADMNSVLNWLTSLGSGLVGNVEFS
jgi:L-2,4-diaminobutyrate decarboxylase